MSKRPLNSLLLLRKREAEQAEKHFAAMMAVERSATQRAADAEAALLSEQRRAADPECDDLAVENFARWLPRGRQMLLDARAAADEAALDTAHARAALAMAQNSVEAVETIIRERQERERVHAARREQNMLDDLRPVGGFV